MYTITLVSGKQHSDPTLKYIPQGLQDYRTVAYRTPLSMEFSRQEYWSG